MLLQRFASGGQQKPVIILNIEDDYRFGDPELTALLKIELNEYL